MPGELRHNRKVLIAAVLAIVAGLQAAGALMGLDNLLAQRRMALSPVEASGDFVFLAIDKKSLDAVAGWPWPRTVHAVAIEALNRAGVDSIHFDVDFSAASTPAADAAFAQAIAGSDALVVLPAFAQDASVQSGGRSFNLPLPLLSENAWLATVNVRADADGVVRRFPYGGRIAGEDIPSLPALLAGVFGPPDAAFAINYRIDPRSVPTASVSDLLEGRIDPAALRGRAVVVGAYALELRDNFTVPVHGIMPGALLQILAAETLHLGRVPVPLAAWPVLAGTVLVLGAICLGWRGGRIAPLAASLAGTSLGIEALAYLAQAEASVVAPTAAVHLALGLIGLGLAAQELDLSKLFLRIATLETDNTRRVLGQIIHDSSDAVLVLSEDGGAIACSRRFRALFAGPEVGPDAEPADLLPEPIRRDLDGSIAALRAGDWRDAGPQVLEFAQGGEAHIVEYTVTPSRLALPGSRWRGAPAERVVVCLTARDITERRAQEARLAWLSAFDELTGALRRAEFLRRVEATAVVAPGPGAVHAVLALNLHRFRTINATLGRSVGDALLRAAVGRLRAADARIAQVARLGGDVFAVACHGPLPAGELEALGRKLTQAFAAAFDLEGQVAHVGLRIGLARGAPGAPAGAEALLAQAEHALDEAVRAGGEAVRAFDPLSSARQDRARLIERELWKSLGRGEMELAYQPQVRLADRALTGAEALVRWTHPVLGRVSPGEFIPIAEASGFVEDLGRWVLATACADAATLPDGLVIAVNVSPAQFQRGDVIADVAAALARAGLPPRRLQVELTETIFVGASEGVLETLADLRMLGVSIALDDFGAGYSSFGYLAKFPLDKIKADQMFVRGLGADPACEAVLRAMRVLSQRLGLKMTCEGIETEAQRAELGAIGCEEGQGYLFGRPQPIAELRALAAAGPAPDGLGLRA